MAPRRPLPPYIATLVERLAPLGEVRPKAMFGGWGLYADGVFFAIVADDILFLKVDDGNRADYEKAAMAPFRPWPDKATTMSYWTVPDDVEADPGRLVAWARKAREAQLRAKR